MEWVRQDDDNDIIQDIARAGYADMLHDEERNDLYNRAIRKTVEQVSKQSKNIKVVDIGTGTGLLSLMAVQAAKNIKAQLKCDAYECFKPMSVCAKEVIETNMHSEKIEVFDIRSDERNTTNIEKADILITELFDTELIGEGAISAYRHALKHLMKPNIFAVPAKARVWVQLVSSDYLYKMNQLSSVVSDLTSRFEVKVPDTILGCPGSGQLHDIQLSQLNPSVDFKIVSKDCVAFEFDFADLDTLKLKESKIINFEMLDNLTLERVSVLFWWDLYMDWEGEIVLSCAPYWEHPSGLKKGDLPWREHWIQAVYHPSANKNLISAKQGETLKIFAAHDEYTFNFDLVTDSGKFCSCGVHNHLSRSRLGMMNNFRNWTPYLNALADILCTKNNINIIFIGDQSVLPFVISSFFGDRVTIFCQAKSTATKYFYESYFSVNQGNISLYENYDDLPTTVEIDVILGEPYFNSVDLPWEQFQFWHHASKLPKHRIKHTTVTIPDHFAIKAIPVQFDHLWKICAPVGTTQGFNLKPFDSLIQSAIECDPLIESQSLWEYPAKPIALEECTVFELKFQDYMNVAPDSYFWTNTSSFKAEKDLISPTITNFSLAFWSEFSYQGETLLNTGPVESFESKKNCKWNREWKQGVSFYFDMKLLDIETLAFKTKFNFLDGKLSLKFER